MRLLYVLVVTGMATLAGAFAAAVAGRWPLAAGFGCGYIAYCVLGSFIVRRLPEEERLRQGRRVEQWLGAFGKAQAGGWTPRSRRRDTTRGTEPK